MYIGPQIEATSSYNEEWNGRFASTFCILEAVGIKGTTFKIYHTLDETHSRMGMFCLEIPCFHEQRGFILNLYINTAQCYISPKCIVNLFMNGSVWF